MHGCYTCVIVAQWVYLLSFSVIWGGIGSVSSMWGAHWGGRLGGSTL